MSDLTDFSQDNTSSGSKAGRLGDMLVTRGILSRDQLEIALQEQRGPNGRDRMLGKILVDMGFVTESAIGDVLAASSGVENINLKHAVLDKSLIVKIPKEVALRYKCLPLTLVDDHLTLAMTDVHNIIVLDQIQRYFPRIKIVPTFAPESQILEAIDQYYDYEMSIDGILNEIETGIGRNEKITGDTEGYVNPTVRLVDAFLVDGIKCGASDLHFEPEQSFVRVRYRIDGDLIQIRSIHRSYWQAIVVRVKILAGMNITETRNPQDGRINYNVLGRSIDLRVATQPTIYGENIVMRILDRQKSLVPMSSLGLSQANETLLYKLLRRPEGIIIVTGPTGSGKTTTLYSILNYINTIEKNIMTLEDPVEYQLSLIRQANVREGSGMNFVDGIKSLMRQDPDVIFIGEIRDSDTANMALRAAMTGHQVFSTLHTNDALGVMPRLLDIGVQRGTLSGSLICVLAQRLVRILCKACKEEVTASEQECRILNVPVENPPRIYVHKGCPACNQLGYKGRIAISEILPFDRQMDELIATGGTRRLMYDHAQTIGYIPMIDDGADKVLRGITDIEAFSGVIDVTSRL